jgi:hypothetical protein
MKQCPYLNECINLAILDEYGRFYGRIRGNANVLR